MRRHPLGYLEAIHKPDLATLQSYYSDRYFQTSKGNYRQTYSQEEYAYIQAKLEQRAAAVRSIFPNLKGRMLDVGCGEGFALAYFSGQGWEVSGIDYSASGVLAMNPNQAHVVETGDVISLLQHRIAHQELSQLVWLSNVLEHVADPPVLLASIRQLISDDGCLVVTVPNDFSLLQNELLSKGVVDDAFWISIPDHLAYFNRDSLYAIANATGWTVKLMLADFPIDWFLAHPRANYVHDRVQGSAAHTARVMLENLIATQPVERVNAFYSAMAQVGLGRQITAYLQPGQKT